MDFIIIGLESKVYPFTADPMQTLKPVCQISSLVLIEASLALLLEISRLTFVSKDY